jgi:heat-inducible transcriptional repressor
MKDLQLSQRRKQVLRVVIQEYVKSAQPVGSKSIAQKYDMGVSASTIRNDLAALEKAGLLTHPHTSAGRIPTDEGYRYFVTHLMAHTDLPSRERQMIRHQFHQARREIDQWLRLSTAVLAKASRGAALATSPRSMSSRVKHLELIGIQDTVVLLVLVLATGTVKQQLITLEQPIFQEELSRASNQLNEEISGANIADLPEKLEGFSGFAREVGELVLNTLHQSKEQIGERVYRHGLAQVLDAPEFADGPQVRRMVQVFEQRSLLQEIYHDVMELNDVQVMIAGEGRFGDMQDISLVLSRYGVPDRVSGLLGVVGPMRMPYGRTIGAVRYVATLLDELMHQIYG